MHYVTAKGILSSQNGMNLYRGCQHGCIYCDSRSDCYHMDHLFEDIEVKENSLVLLEDALRRKRRPCMIGTGSMSDPYMPLERELRYTRRALELIEKHGFGATLITKSTQVLDDLDLFKRIHKQAKCVIQMTLTTSDETLCRIIEPNVSTTKERIKALKTLRDNGIPTVVWLTPILPFLNDTSDNLNAILNDCEDASVKGILFFGAALTLRDGNREYFYRALDQHFPGLKETYIRQFGNSYILESPNNAALSDLFHRRCETAGIWHDNQQIFHYLSTFEQTSQLQLSLFES